MTPTTFEWSFIPEGVIETGKTFKELIECIEDYGGLRVNQEKMKKDLDATGEFIYGLGLYKVKKVN